MADSSQSQSPGLLANILAVAGFIILIVIIVWGAYHLLRLTGSGVSTLFNRFTGGGSTIAVTAPAAPVQSGDEFDVSWRYSPNESGSYAFLYQCKSGFRFTSGSTAIPCGSAFTVGTGTSLTLTPVLSGAPSLEVPFSIVFMPSATTSTSRPQGTGTIAVSAAPSNNGSPANNPAPNAGMTGSGSANTGSGAQTGTPDLWVRISAIGVIEAGDRFVIRKPTSSSDIVAVKFDIVNVGSGPTGEWYFSASLPTDPVTPYVSPIQKSLGAGDHIENTLRFNHVDSGGTFILIVDPANTVRESNEGNNTASQYVDAY
jgi:hypothetical protein